MTIPPQMTHSQSRKESEETACFNADELEKVMQIAGMYSYHTELVRALKQMIEAMEGDDKIVAQCVVTENTILFIALRTNSGQMKQAGCEARRCVGSACPGLLSFHS